jgi:signal transduction histidine kinase/ActR/RegA family two-component response regulator
VALCIYQAFTNDASTVFLSTGIAWAVLLMNRFVKARTQERKTAALQLREAHEELAHEKAERMRLQRELEVAQRMDSLGRLAGAFSHEFNNQLMAIRIHAELLERALPRGSAQRGDLEQILRTTGAAADLTSRLLAFSRPNRTREEPADLCAVLRQSLVTLRPVMTEKTPVAWSAPDDPVYAPVGTKQLGQILLNLALNARDAMPQGGALRVSVERVPRASVELPFDIRATTLAVLTVTDTGSGMSPEVRDRVFEPFFTTKSGVGNAGLGLSVVYGIVKETGGHIRVTSEPGAGTRFDVYWPEVPASEARAVVPAEGAPSAGHRARVLLVEDQPALRDGLTRWLGDHGFAVVPCESGEEALARANDVDVIASDVVLRGMDGIELLGRLRREAPELPAVLFSGHLDHLATQRRAIPEGVMFLEKPFAPEALLTTLDTLVAGPRVARGAVAV